jgi:protein ImuB
MWMQNLAKIAPLPEQTKPRGRHSRLWLALHFHALPLFAAQNETLISYDFPMMSISGDTAATPVAIYQRIQQAEYIIAASPEALRNGISLMMKTGEARLACPLTKLLPRNTARERELLVGLADRLGEFSSEVHTSGDLVLLMEIGRSLTLFGGLGRLIQCLSDRLAHAPDYQYALAPVPMAAMLCARSGYRVHIDFPEHIRSILGDIPVIHFEHDPRTRNLLSSVGIHVMRDLFRLPRQGLARRFGSAFVRKLDRLLGTEPDILPRHASRKRFHALLHLEEESTNVDEILFNARVLLEDLEQQLLRSNSAVRHLRWTINAHRAQGQLVLTTGFARPVWRADTIEELLRLRLASIILATPVRTLSLESEDFMPLSASLQTGIPGTCSAIDSDPGFLDRLRSRLGEQAVRGIRSLPEYRPEHAWSTCEPGKSLNARTQGTMRPVWLLVKPRPLATRHGLPQLDGPLKLHEDEERVCCGWWDGGNIVRDYRRALTSNGQRIWVFRDLSTQKWHLHGFY